MGSRSSLRNWAEYLAARTALGFLAAVPYAVALKLASRLARLAVRRLARWRQAAEGNLEIAFPDSTPAWRQSVLQGMCDSLARLLVLLPRLPRINRSNVQRWIRYEDYRYFEEAVQRGRGVLFAAAHLGNWELSAYAHALMATPMHVVVRPLDNPLLDRWLTRVRTGSGNRIIGKKDFARSILTALRNNQAVGVLIDQNTVAPEGIFVDFFGRSASTSPAFAKLAARTGATVLPGFAVWNRKEGKYVLRFYPPVEITGNLRADTERCQAAIERAVREYPEQWLWIHRRFKSRPPGEDPLY